MSSWASRIFHDSAPNHSNNKSSGRTRSPASKIDHNPGFLTAPLPPRSTPASSSPSSSASTVTVHPYSMVSTPHQYSSAHDMDDEGECPVCLEPLSFSFRLPGEKPHIVPECGHALHEVSHSDHLGITLCSFDTPGLLQRRLWPSSRCRQSRWSASQVQPWRMRCMQTSNEGS